MNKILVVFHSNCLDGLASASIIREALGEDRVEFYPALYQTPPPDMKGRVVYIIDFSWAPEVLLPAIVEAESVVMIDHHETAMKAWMGVDELPEHLKVIFDISKSGAALCWEFFNPGKNLPHPNELLQDYDLHAGRYPNSHAYAAGVAASGCLLTNDLKLFEEVVWLRPVNAVCKEGEVVMQVNKNHIAGMIDRSMRMVEVQGFTVPIANIPYQFATQAGGILCQGHPFSITYEDQHPTGRRKYDLRAVKGSAVHCGDIAKVYGGGGHQGAAGFYMPLEADFFMELNPVPAAHAETIKKMVKAAQYQVTFGPIGPEPEVLAKPDLNAYVTDELINDFANVVTTFRSTYKGPAADNAVVMLNALVTLSMPELADAIRKKVKENLM